MLIETIASTLDEALQLEALGADRIELVTAVSEGGLTPSKAMIKQVCSRLSIPVNIMLKTRKDYQFTDLDMLVMLEDLEYIKTTKASGIVFGALKGKSLNKEYIERVIENKGSLTMTLNRCFDRSEDFEATLAYVKDLKIDRMLTSGHESSVITGSENFKLIQNTCHNFVIMAGAGLTIENVKDFILNVKPEEIHFGSGTHLEGKWDNNIDPKSMELLCNLK
ncbi:MAG: copper homeostasis protein CutC [Erysipelotrichaceae bacterium]